MAGRPVRGEAGRGVAGQQRVDERDPLASCRVTEAGYAGMTASLRRVCAELGVPLGMVLEGGYDVGALAGSVCELLPVLGGDEIPAAGHEELDVHPLAEGAVRRLQRWWPGLAATSA
jgi:acetoin utilization deacetylase AcuC-like enzyme